MRGWLASLLIAVASLGCRDANAPRPAPPPEAEAPRLKPMTSRDGSPPPETANSPALPVGHPPIAGAPAAGHGQGSVTGTVTVAAQYEKRGGAALFLVARSAGSGQILAVRKETQFAFPFAFQISGVDAMTDGTSFDGPFDITARLSKTGDAMPGAGDLEGQAKGVAGGARDVKITLDTVRQ